MKKEDLRIVKTKEKLSLALVEILKKKPIKDIKISELCTAAEVSRATFYNNFSSVEQVFTYFISTFEEPMEQRLEKEMKKANLEDKSIVPKMWMSFIFPIVSELEKHRDDFCDIIDRQDVSGDFYSAILKLMTSVVNKMLKIYHLRYDVDVPDEVFLSYAAGGMSSLIIRLLLVKDKYTLEEKQYFVYHLAFEMADYYFENHQSGEKKNG